MAERPILFGAPLVRAILDGRKTQTRRLYRDAIDAVRALLACPYGQPGDELWARETWQIATGLEPGDLGAVIRYRDMQMRAVTMPSAKPMPLGLTFDRWRPSIHMPRWASRIQLQVTGVRVERLHDLTDADARAEGVDSRAEFAALWDSISGDRAPWASDPWVWVVTFERVSAGGA